MSPRVYPDKSKAKKREPKLTDPEAIRQFAESQEKDYTPLVYHAPVYIAGKDKDSNRVIVIVSHRMDAHLDSNYLYLYVFSMFAQVVCIQLRY